MITAIERDFINTIQASEVSSDLILVAKETAARMFSLDSSSVKSSMVNNFIFNLYSKLIYEKLIPISEKDPLLHVLHNIANFRLDKDNDRLMCFLIGEMRSCRLPVVFIDTEVRKSETMKELVPKIVFI